MYIAENDAWSSLPTHLPVAPTVSALLCLMDHKSPSLLLLAVAVVAAALALSL